MKLTTSQKVFGVLLGVGLVALVLDRAGGASADPSSTAAAAADNAVPAAARDAPQDGPAGVATTSLATRLEALRAAVGPADAVRDAFVPSSAWAGGEARGPDRGADRVAAFRRAHVLKAVVQSGRRGQAMVDGRLVAVGQSVDGFELVDVGRLRAVFAQDDVRAELTLPQAEPANR